jgi:hypothetical protein
MFKQNMVVSDFANSHNAILNFTLYIRLPHTMSNLSSLLNRMYTFHGHMNSAFTTVGESYYSLYG